MKIYTSIEFAGHWPVGTAAVIVANDCIQAAILLQQQLTIRGLMQIIDPARLVEIDIDEPCCFILCDGNY